MGIDEEYVLNLDQDAKHFVCSICTDVCGDLEPRDATCRLDPPVLAKPCDHNFCYACIKSWLGEKKTCPKCNVEVTHLQALGANRFASQMYANVHIRCPVSADCGWKGTIPDCAVHLRTKCQFAKMACKLCGEAVERRALEAHLAVCPDRPLECEYCKETLPANEMEPHLKRACREIPVPCACGRKCPRRLIVSHVLMTEGISRGKGGKQLPSPKGSPGSLGSPGSPTSPRSVASGVSEGKSPRLKLKRRPRNAADLEEGSYGYNQLSLERKNEIKANNVLRGIFGGEGKVEGMNLASSFASTKRNKAVDDAIRNAAKTRGGRGRR